MSRFIDRGVRDKMERIVPKFDGGTEPDPETPLPAQLDLRALLRGRFGPNGLR